MRLLYLLIVAIAHSGVSLADERPSLAGTVELKRVAEGLWQASYCFEKPVQIFGFERPIKNMRETHWRSATPNISLKYTADDTAQLQADGGGRFRCVAVNIRPYLKMPPKNYYAFSPFSDGGMSIYSGYLTGSAFLDGEWHSIEFEASYSALENERVIAADDHSLGHQFVYFGKQEVVQNDLATMVVDPVMPQGVVEKIIVGLRETDKLLQHTFRYSPEAPHLIFLAAGELYSYSGTSIKGGTRPRQILFTLKGKGAAKIVETDPLYYPRLTVHEVLHLWQNDVWFDQLGNDHQWVHEGSADALAYEFMYRSGLFDREAYRQSWQKVERQCRELLAGASVHGGPDAGEFDIVYRCGAYANYLIGAGLNGQNAGDGILQFWTAMAEWGEDTIRQTPSEELVFKTMAKLGFSDTQIKSLKRFLDTKPDDIDQLFAVTKASFGLKAKTLVQVAD